MSWFKNNFLTLLMVFYIIFSFLFYIDITSARYVTFDEISGEATVALMNSSVVFANIENIFAVPGETKEYDIKITNGEDGKVAEVALSYILSVEKIEDNIPLEYTIRKYASDEDLGKTVVGELEANILEEDIYKICITWPEEYNDYTYSDEVEAFSLKVVTHQID